MAEIKEREAFAEEIAIEELDIQEQLGRGAFGTVHRAIWRGKQVAVKQMDTDNQRKAFVTEVKQLSRVNHPNIVQLYGASTAAPVFLVMEYAEGGSLYDVLHGEGPQPDYTTGHFVSWCLQCAQAVEYLHDMKPKPLVHRDLKPPNLLLVAEGTILKICDFGTACDKHTHMTNNKGSAAWMAPEVFESNNYNEKCDVFSFGIIMWEVMTRRRPFQELGGGVYAIMWAVHSGRRPPLIQKCPLPIEQLMTSCWHANPGERPAFSHIVHHLSALAPYFQGANEPLVYPSPRGEATEDPVSSLSTGSSSLTDTPPLTSRPNPPCTETGPQGEGEPVSVLSPLHVTPPVVIEVSLGQRRTSAPASLATSVESLPGDKGSRSATPSADLHNKRYSDDISKLDCQSILSDSSKTSFHKTHRRSGSFGSTPVNQESLKPPGRGHVRSGSHGSSAIVTSEVDFDLASNGEVVQCADENGQDRPLPPPLEADLLALLDPELHPLEPVSSCPESVALYCRHLELARAFTQMRREVTLATQQKHDLQREVSGLDDDEKQKAAMVLEVECLTRENTDLELYYSNLTQQLCRSSSEA